MTRDMAQGQQAETLRSSFVAKMARVWPRSMCQIDMFR